MQEWITAPLRPVNEAVASAARAHQLELTKPPGALGRLEELAIRLATLVPDNRRGIESCHISIFAADHGVAAESVSAFPQAVTAEMIRNFSAGGAAISVLAKHHRATLEVINLGTVSELPPLAKVIDARIAPGTRNMTETSAMTSAQLDQALAAGKLAAERAYKQQAELFIGGEMGIANTTSATAIACALLDEVPEQLVGPGTGLDGTGVAHKASVIRKALLTHQAKLACPLSILQHLGGFEIAALSGAYLRCGQIGLPVLVDGFIASVAALCAVRLQPALQHWLFFAHQSAEPGHQKILAAMQASPLLQLGMRLGEGSGAAVAFPLLQMASKLHWQMATFAEAGVTNAD